MLRKIGEYIDRSTRSGIDSTYIIVPERPWQLILKNNVNQSTYYLQSHMSNAPGEDEYTMDWKPRVTNGVGMSTGLWIGYRGYGLGYQKSLSSNDDLHFMFSACGSRYGLSLRLSHYEASKVKLRFNSVFHFVDDGVEEIFQVDEDMDMDLESPILVRSFLIEGYYLFNGKHYSNTAVYDQSVQQVKSAGSLMAGVTWFRSAIEYADVKSSEFVSIMNREGRSKQWQLALGLGYAYNWVPQRNWLVSIQAMPMLSVINGLRSWNYDIEYTEVEGGDGAAGDEEFGDYQAKLVPGEMETTRSRIMPAGVARLGVVYNYKRFFLTLNGQVATFGYKHDDNSARLLDWYANTSLGIRF